jgi:hypothetical protein
MDRIPISFDKASTGLRIAQVVGLTTASFAAGSIASFSLFVTPALLQAPAPILVKQWQTCFDKGATALPPLTVVGAVIFGALAYLGQSLTPSYSVHY